MNTTVGTCGNCGGPVQVPADWYGIEPPTPTCAHCGAVAKSNYGPTIPMNAPRDAMPWRDQQRFDIYPDGSVVRRA
jgi:hypothetical protein